MLPPPRNPKLHAHGAPVRSFAQGRRTKRLMWIGAIATMLVLAVGLILNGLSDKITFFRSPSDVLAGKVRPGEHFRLGGLVVAGSVERPGDQRVHFAITDGDKQVAVRFTGLLPDLFREGQGIIAEGKMAPDGAFVASTVLAKHDENYLPREVADSLKKQGVWKDSPPGGKPFAPKAPPGASPTDLPKDKP